MRSMDSNNTTLAGGQVTDDLDNPKVKVITTLKIAAYTKDSVHVKWDIGNEYASKIEGYMVSYQATGSHVVQYSHHLAATDLHYDIKKLHEDTSYDVCVKVFTNKTMPKPLEPCIEATTRTDSFHVALGSALGAFMALGIIIGFVFLAKWQHTRRLKKRLQKLGLNHAELHNGDIYHSRDMGDVEYAVSDLSMRVNEEQMKLSELNSAMGDYDHVTEGSAFLGVASPSDIPECIEEAAHSYHSNEYFDGSNDHCRCDVSDELSPADSYLGHSPNSLQSSFRSNSRRLRNFYQQSMDSTRSLGITRQQSVDSYGSGHNRASSALLRKQLSVDIAGSSVTGNGCRQPYKSCGIDSFSHRSRDSGLYSYLPHQKSHDSDNMSECSGGAGSGVMHKGLKSRGVAREGSVDSRGLSPGWYDNHSPGVSNKSRSPREGSSSRSKSREVSPVKNPTHLFLASSERVAAEATNQNQHPVQTTEKQTPQNPFQNSDGSPPDVRPKIKKTQDNKHEINSDLNSQKKGYPEGCQNVEKSESAVIAQIPNTKECVEHATNKDNSHAKPGVSDIIITPSGEEIECVNDGGHAKGIRPNYSCPNW